MIFRVEMIFDQLNLSASESQTSSGDQRSVRKPCIVKVKEISQVKSIKIYVVGCSNNSRNRFEIMKTRCGIFIFIFIFYFQVSGESVADIGHVRPSDRRSSLL
jgi:hypothetical protein